MMTTSIESIHLRNLPPYAKVYVGIFTALMLCVCLWATWIYTARYGRVDTKHLPAYLHEAKSDLKADITELQSDSQAVMAPVWDKEHAGREQKVDSAAISAIERESYAPDDQNGGAWRDLGLAHTHMNGQTLLFFAIGLVFLFTSLTPQRKKIVYWIFGVTVLAHTIGLTGKSYGSIFRDLLAVSGIAICLVIAFMAFAIFSDLAKKPTD
jgi:hypothetical protein